jgi:hypothetical protein
MPKSREHACVLAASILREANVALRRKNQTPPLGTSRIA